MMPSRKNDSTHWTERAAQMRAFALTIKHPETIILPPFGLPPAWMHSRRRPVDTVGGQVPGVLENHPARRGAHLPLTAVRRPPR